MAVPLAVLCVLEQVRPKFLGLGADGPAVRHSVQGVVNGIEYIGGAAHRLICNLLLGGNQSAAAGSFNALLERNRQPVVKRVAWVQVNGSNKSGLGVFVNLCKDVVQRGGGFVL